MTTSFPGPMPNPSRNNTSSDLMTEPTVTFPVVPIDMATICRLLTVRPEDQAIAVMTASTPPLEGEMMFALPRVTKKYGNRGRSKQFAPNVCAIVTLSQLNLLLRMTNFIRRELNEAAFGCPFVGVYRQRTRTVEHCCFTASTDYHLLREGGENTALCRRQPCNSLDRYAKRCRPKHPRGACHGCWNWQSY
jgi:hypothetical protein